MSKIALSGDASGTGTFTIASPNSNNNRTLTIPDAAGTLALLQTPSFATTIGVGGATPATTGAGITFPASQSASSDANTLDDYEEGTWTPSLRFGSNNTGMVVSAAVASYTKIGRVVHAQFRFSYSTKGSSTGASQVFGLPFPATGNAVQQGYSTGIFTFESNGGVATVVGLFALAWEDSTLYLRANAGSTGGYTTVTDANFGATSEIWGSVVYRTAS